MFKKFFSLFFISCFMVLQACFGGDPGSDKDLNIIHVTDSITSDTTWTSDNIYVIDDTIAVTGATLTIEPGTIIKISTYGGSQICQPFYLNEEGSAINAAGTSDKHIIFTSYADDTKGGDTDGVEGSPAKGDWGYIFISPDEVTPSTFAYCDFYYGGYGNYETDSMLWIRGIAKIDHCIFAHSLHSALDVSSAVDTTTVTNNTFYDNTKPMWMNPDFSIDGSNSFFNPDDSTEGNDYNGIWMINSYGLSEDRNWGNNGVPYVFSNGYYFVVGNMDNKATTLTVADGTVVKFYDTVTGGSISNGEGGVIIYDYDSIANLDNAFFTSYLDDDHGGDTNMDGTLTSAADGDWEGIEDGAQTDVWISSSGILYDSH